MTTKLEDKMIKLDPAQRTRVEARAGQLIAAETTLRAGRKARKLTKVRSTKAKGIF